MNLFFFETAGSTEGLAGMYQYQVHDFFFDTSFFIQWFFRSGPKTII